MRLIVQNRFSNALSELPFSADVEPFLHCALYQNGLVLTALFTILSLAHLISFSRVLCFPMAKSENEPRISLLERQNISICFQAPPPPPSHIEWETGTFSPGVKLPGREADHSHPASAEVKNTWIHASTSPLIIMASCLIS